METRPPALGVWGLSHWATREAPGRVLLPGAHGGTVPVVLGFSWEEDLFLHVHLNPRLEHQSLNHGALVSSIW